MQFLKFSLLFVLLASTKLTWAYSHEKASMKPTVADLDENKYDVKYVKIDLTATNLTTSIQGSSTTIAKVVATSLSDYVFELSNQLIIDSAIINGLNLPVQTINNFVRKIALPNSLPAQSTFQVTVYYHGVPTGGSGFFTNGILNGTAGNPPQNITHTVSAAYHSRDWFPCKQSLTDKIDSADIWITVAPGLKAASNGLLKNVSSVNGQIRYEWKTKYPIDYYLLSFVVGDYQEYNYTMHFSNNDSMLVNNYVFPDSITLANSQAQLDSVQHIINYFSELFGQYPFHKEKTGVILVPLSGGMENQTLVSVGNLEPTLVAHELSHQWWGDHVTCGTIADMWLNEGFATYCEHLYLEHFRSNTITASFRNTMFNQTMTGAAGSVYVSDTTDEARIYSGRLTYYKGASVAHMLRYLIYNDTVFFQLLKNYQQQFSFGNATTNDLLNLANQISGQSLDTFFNQWIYQEGYPIYSAKWYQTNNQVYLKITQITSKPTSVPTFKLPLEIKLKSSLGDTIIKVINETPTQYVNLNWTKPMTGLEFDPNNNIVNKQGLISQDPSLSISATEINPIEIVPNPSNGIWTISQLNSSTHLKVVNNLGQILFEKDTDSPTEIIDLSAISSGLYWLSIVEKNGHCICLPLLKN